MVHMVCDYIDLKTMTTKRRMYLRKKGGNENKSKLNLSAFTTGVDNSELPKAKTVKASRKKKLFTSCTCKSKTVSTPSQPKLLSKMVDLPITIFNFYVYINNLQ